MGILSSIKHFLEENSKRKNWILGGILLFLVLLFSIFSQHGLLKKVQLELEKRELAVEIEREKVRSDSLRNIMDKLKNDTTEIEKVAREKYGLIRPGEEVIFVLPEKAAEENK